ncbi:hypothetical protein M1M30_gp187 [Maribacter phage Colly_1]|uniref:Lipoprotein n=1 Tax=Maribacter phage Colly_1 TaxID=2745691 RepID=A0A8E4XVA1_9CAUD|nr:hypothetical protein M1M30_gp187 [Maribacter phage Colly_1]QQO97292.1 hypothetical protein Colly1_187 [Maribacter phage Colly_1]
MKKVILILVAIFLLFSSCSPDEIQEDVITQEIKQRIAGLYEIQETSVVRDTTVTSDTGTGKTSLTSKVGETDFSFNTVFGYYETTIDSIVRDTIATYTIVGTDTTRTTEIEEEVFTSIKIKPIPVTIDERYSGPQGFIIDSTLMDTEVFSFRIESSTSPIRFHTYLKSAEGIPEGLSNPIVYGDEYIIDEVMEDIINPWYLDESKEVKYFTLIFIPSELGIQEFTIVGTTSDGSEVELTAVIEVMPAIE